jgi:hypothetical protein
LPHYDWVFWNDAVCACVFLWLLLLHGMSWRRDVIKEGAEHCLECLSWALCLLCLSHRCFSCQSISSLEVFLSTRRGNAVCRQFLLFLL